MTLLEAEARTTASVWGQVDSLRMVSHRENAVFEVRFANGRHGALRLHRAGYQTDEAIRAELAWMNDLRHVWFHCPAPIPTPGGDYLAFPSFDQRASLVGWIDAPPVGPDSSLTPDAQIALYHRIGELIAKLHASPVPHHFPRPDWDLEGLLGEKPLWGPFWHNPSLVSTEVALLLDVRRAAGQDLLQTAYPVGAIHADLLQENILQDDGGGLHLIDFDDCGRGFLAYDLGTALIQHYAAPHYADLRDALADGYGAKVDLDMFVMLRALASAGWIMSRARSDDPLQRSYAERALSMAQRWSER